MASWSEFFRTNDYNYTQRASERIASDSGSVASQMIRYPAHPSDVYVYGAAPVECPRQITMELNVPICCEGCEERVLSRLIDIDGVQSVKCDQLKQRVTVSGTAAPAEVLAACKKLFKRSRWCSS